MGMTMRIAEVADRSGFSAATLRYYEELDLLPAPPRTAAGYRSYDESVLDRLAFIARAKALGCSLEEVADLMPEWDGGRCAPVQGRLRELASAKLDDVDARVAELVAFGGDLRRILSTLGTHTPDGPCDATCGCLTSSCVTAAPPPVPVACTLAVADLPDRLSAWRAIADHVVGREAVDGGIRVHLDGATSVADLAVLMEAEQGCCAFFAFALTVDGRGVALEVRAPAEGMAMVDTLFGGNLPG